jgi:hypothetical protein
MDPPDYTTEQFRDIRENLILALAMTEQEAIDHLSDAWRWWNPRAQQGDPPGQQQPNPPALQPVNPPPVQQRGDNQAPQNTATGARPQSPPTIGEKKKNHPKFRHGQTMTTFRRHFIHKGREATATHATALKTETFAITASDSNLTLTPARSSSTPKGFILQNEDLIYGEMSIAKNGLIAYMAKCGWRDENIRPFMDFYILLDTHEIRDEPQGDRAIVIYQAQARRNWQRMESLLTYQQSMKCSSDKLPTRSELPRTTNW